MNKNNFRDVLLWNSREVILMVFSLFISSEVTFLSIVRLSEWM